MGTAGVGMSFRNTKHADKPNEDYFICDSEHGIFMVLDGVSRDRIGGAYPNPSPALEVTELFAGQVHGYIAKGLAGAADVAALIRDAYAYGNDCVRAYNRRGVYDFLPGTVGIAAIVCADMLYYGYIGDCFGRVVSVDAVDVFTKCQTEHVHKHAGAYTADEIRKVICNNKAHPSGYGVIDGREGAMDFVETGRVALAPETRVILSTDGAEDALERLDAAGLYRLSAEEAAYLLEHGTKNIDDRTVVFVDCLK